MTSPTFSLHGKVGLVTGAGRGIGKAIALALAEAGADIVAVARTGSEIEATAQEARALGRRVEAIEADISDPNDVEAMSRQARQRFERIDIVVNNAAASFFQPLVPLPGYDPPSELPAFRTPTTDEAWEATLATNLSGPFLRATGVGPANAGAPQRARHQRQFRHTHTPQPVQLGLRRRERRTHFVHPKHG